jgi:hypothetical protein
MIKERKFLLLFCVLVSQLVSYRSQLLEKLPDLAYVLIGTSYGSETYVKTHLEIRIGTQYCICKTAGWTLSP